MGVVVLTKVFKRKKGKKKIVKALWRFKETDLRAEFGLGLSSFPRPANLIAASTKDSYLSDEALQWVRFG